MFICKLNATSSFNLLTSVLVKSYLDYAGLPVIQPNNESFPYNYGLNRLSKLYLNKTIIENRFEAFINVSSPHTGTWYSSAFIDNTQRKEIKPDVRFRFVSCFLFFLFSNLFL
jgi:hypothetical protein